MRKPLLLIIALLGWFAVIAQFVLMIGNSKLPLSETIIRFFSYYTILTNIVVAVFCTISLFNDSEKIQRLATPILVYIFVVGLVYNAILRQLWQPQGLQRLVDELLHTIIPLLYIVFWFVFVDKRFLRWQNILPWLIYPFVYLVYILIRGASSGFYPYPFVDVNQLGYTKVIINSVMMTVVFVLFSLLFAWIGRVSTVRYRGVR